MTSLALACKLNAVNAPRSRVAKMISALTRAGATVIWPERAMGFGNPNLLSAPEFANGVTDLSTRAGLVTLSSLAGYDGAIAFGRDGVTLSLAYKTYPTVSGLTYTLSAIVKMDDGLAPSFDQFSTQSVNGSFALVIGNIGVVPGIIESLGSGVYRVSASRAATDANTGVGVIKYPTNNNRTFKVTGYKLEQSTTATAYTPQSQLRELGIYQDSAGVTPVTALTDLMGLVLDRTPNVGGVAVARYGPELAGLSTPWQSYGTGISLSGGQMLFNATPAGQFALRGTPLTASKWYQLEFTIASISGGGISMIVGGGASTVVATAPGTYRATVKATAADGPYLWVTTATTAAVVTSATCKEVRGNHATQATAASKPSIGRVPKRLGAELTPTGTVWPVVANATRSSNMLPTTLTATAASNPYIAIPSKLVIGTAYQVTIEWSGNTSNRSILINETGVPAKVSPGTSGSWTTWFTATAATTYAGFSSATVGETFTITSVSTKEVLEWSPAMIFDPAAPGDFLQTGITTGNTGWVCAGVQFNGQVANTETIFANGAGNDSSKGVWFTILTSAVRMGVGNGSALAMAYVYPGNIIGRPLVVEGGWDASTVFVGADGVVNTVARTGDATPAPNPPLIGAYMQGIHHLNGPMTCIVICPTLPPAADRALIRKFIGWLQAQTL